MSVSATCAGTPGSMAVLVKDGANVGNAIILGMNDKRCVLYRMSATNQMWASASDVKCPPGGGQFQIDFQQTGFGSVALNNTYTFGDCSPTGQFCPPMIPKPIPTYQVGDRIDICWGFQPPEGFPVGSATLCYSKFSRTITQSLRTHYAFDNCMGGKCLRDTNAETLFIEKTAVTFADCTTQGALKGFAFDGNQIDDVVPGTPKPVATTTEPPASAPTDLPDVEDITDDIGVDDAPVMFDLPQIADNSTALMK
ncbi:hypothetical protein HDV05_002891 [Chytridiales sp. JEL 0842]|nr:hypothetical protein HDV05_002891 [Chytridiales sp. JEL 0842]